MKVVLINKSDTVGGAAVAAFRLTAALHNEGVDARMLVSEGMDGMLVEEINKTYLSQKKAFARFLWERLYFLRFEKSKKERYSYSPANTGMDITNHPLVKEADIIHLHWTNQGYLSLNNIKKLMSMGKPVVWTLHDMWSFTGGCHYNGNCHEFLESCGHCPFLKHPAAKDISYVQLARKKNIYKNADLHIVTCSKWLKSLASESTLFRHKPCSVIPNPIDTDFYSPQDKQECRKKLNLPADKKLLMFGAANINDPRKGIKYLIEALNILHANYPEVKDQLELVIFGKAHKGEQVDIPFKTHLMRYINNNKTLVQLYSAADAYALPSLQDNLPNTVMEAMSCATPVIGFRIGGVPEMIEHEKSGYLSEVRNAQSLADGIYQTLFVNDIDKMADAARLKVLENYSEKIVAKKYIEIYRKILK